MQGAVFLLLILSVANISAVPVASDLKSEDVVFKIKPDVIQNGGTGNQSALSAVLFKTVMRYYCTFPEFEKSSTTILYGSKGWSFPEQDVNLTLSYPTSNEKLRRNFSDYRISGYKVIIFTDGSECTGTIAAGGLMQDHMTLNFIMNQITVLSYELWLYGVSAADVPAEPYHHNYNRMC